MPYKDKSDRNYKKEYALQKARGEGPARAKRAAARAAYDRAGIDRKGKDIDHTVPLSKNGGNGLSNTRLKAPSANRSFKRNADGSVKKNVPYPKGKRNPVQNG